VVEAKKKENIAQTLVPDAMLQRELPDEEDTESCRCFTRRDMTTVRLSADNSTTAGKMSVSFSSEVVQLS